MRLVFDQQKINDLEQCVVAIFKSLKTFSQPEFFPYETFGDEAMRDLKEQLSIFKGVLFVFHGRQPVEGLPATWGVSDDGVYGLTRLHLQYELIQGYFEGVQNTYAMGEPVLFVSSEDFHHWKKITGTPTINFSQFRGYGVFLGLSRNYRRLEERLGEYNKKISADLLSLD